MRTLARTGTWLLLAAAMAVAGCGSEASPTASLRLALADNPAPLDPDTYYEAQGTIITNATYEGLVQYKPDSPEIEGLLATSWKVSPDGRTYTFRLRRDVRFSDGTPFDSKAAKASFERRIALEGGPSYMLADVASMETPSPNTFVVGLKKPVAAFLDYLASPFGPMMISPAAVKRHASGDDRAAKWLGSHSAGTGPYVLAEVRRSVRYVLEANSRYWGPEPHFEQVVFSIVPDVETQRLQLEGGSLDLVVGGLTSQDLEALAGADGVQVKRFPALLKGALWVNPESPVFGSPEVRGALRAALDNVELTRAIYGSQARPSREVYPPGMLRAGAAPDTPSVDPDRLPRALTGGAEREVVIGWWADAGMKALANRLQVRLRELGVDAAIREYSAAEVLAMPTKPKARPDLMAMVLNPDSVAPDTWARVYWRRDAPVNVLGCTVSEADRHLDAAAAEPDRERATDEGVKAALAYRDSNCWLNVSDVFDTIAARAGLTGFEHQLPWLMAVKLAALKER